MYASNNSAEAAVNMALLVGASLSIVAALLHLAIIVGGPNWYRRFGAGEQFAAQAAAGSWIPPITTLGIALVLFAWAGYALSGAGLIGPLPLLKPALVIIATIYWVRGMAIIPLLTLARQHSTPFLIYSSLVCLVYGAVHAIGLAQVWSRL